MKKSFNIIEGFYSDFGHYIDGMIKNADVSNDYQITYYVNGLVNERNKKRLRNVEIVEFDCGHSVLGQLKFLFRVIQCADKDGFNFIASIHYISLAIFIIISGFKNLYLLIHYFPTVHKIIYRIVFKVFLKKINSFVVFSESVKQDVLENIGYSHIAILNALDIEECNVKRSEAFLTVSFIGAMNETKDVESLINVLVNNEFKHIKFRLLSKGIASWCEGKTFANDVEIIDDYFDHEIYTHYLKDSDFIFLSYKNNYGVRCSGMVFDALNNGCGLICNENKSFEFLKGYNVSYFFDSEDTLKKVLINLTRLEVPSSLKVQYSKMARIKKLNELLLSYFKNKKEIQ